MRKEGRVIFDGYSVFDDTWQCDGQGWKLEYAFSTRTVIVREDLWIPIKDNWRRLTAAATNGERPTGG